MSSFEKITGTFSVHAKMSKIPSTYGVFKRLRYCLVNCSSMFFVFFSLESWWRNFQFLKHLLDYFNFAMYIFHTIRLSVYNNIKIAWEFFLIIHVKSSITKQLERLKLIRPDDKKTLIEHFIQCFIKWNLVERIAFL